MEDLYLQASLSFIELSKVLFPFAFIWRLGAKTLKILLDAILGNNLTI